MKQLVIAVIAATVIFFVFKNYNDIFKQDLELFKQTVQGESKEGENNPDRPAPPKTIIGKVKDIKEIKIKSSEEDFDKEFGSNLKDPFDQQHTEEEFIEEEPQELPPPPTPANYRRAVNLIKKANLAQVKHYKSYALYAMMFEDLDINIPNAVFTNCLDKINKSNKTCVQSGGFEYMISGGSAAGYTLGLMTTDKRFSLLITKGSKGGENISCAGSNQKSQDVCRSLGGVFDKDIKTYKTYTFPNGLQ
ncbi:hypothetical protein Dip510_001757 [Elusimicrobium posterum]|uniref:hypothetical protein n=1 Tax=Elusimicrobium posterum TaxID=3116653 RepID=UPI003C729D2B